MLAAMSRGLVAFVLCVAGLAAQQRISLRGDQAPRTPLERQVRRLDLPDQRADAMQQLWQAGDPAVPLLIAAAERPGPGALAALQVLAAMGGAARSALPALQRMAKAGDPALRGPAAFVAAQIGERESVLVPAYSKDQIVELDGDGKELRTWPMDSPWCVVPLPDDRVLVACYNGGKVVELDAKGNEVRSFPVPENPAAVVRLVTGETIVACFGGKAIVALDADGKELWRIGEIEAMDVRGRCNGNVLACLRNKNSVVEYERTGKVVRTVEVGANPMAARELANGNLLVTFDDAKKVVEFDPAGKAVREWTSEHGPCGAAPWADGGLLVTDDHGVGRCKPDGSPIWHVELGHTGHPFVRAAGR